MCGISGILEFDISSAAGHEAEAMSARLRHRGPDGRGLHREGPVVLAHRRLSIIDLKSGAQPMSTEDGRVWITYNGELYNFRELRDELKSTGHVFRTQSDTEVVVRAWEEWGERCVERFRGMFAFAIADHRRRVLFLARDHLGIKPLYYFRTRARFVFASELQALRVLPDCPDEIDPKALDNYLFLLYVAPPRTIYKDVWKLPPAHRITIDFDGSTRGPEEYWKLSFEPERGLSFEEWGKRLEWTVRDSVRAHLMADVPFGAFLSGGIDSTAIVALMSEELAEPVRTFSIGFEEQGFSELEYARMVASRFGTDHYEETVRPDAVSILPQLVRQYGEPFGDSSAIPTFYVSRLARRHVSMALTGDGGDEAFLGYDRYFRWFNWVNPASIRRAAWKHMLRSGLQVLMPRRFPGRRSVQPQDWLAWVTGVGTEVRKEIWRPEFIHLTETPIEEIEEVIRDAGALDAEQIGQYVDYRTYLPHDILTKVDIASMCHGLETRTPLADVRVAEFATTIPWSMNLRQNGDGEWTGKHLLKWLVGKYFGTEFLERRKTGFGVPLKSWFAVGGALRQELEERFCLVHNARIFHYFEPDRVRSLVKDHGSSGGDNSQSLWQLLFLENWLEQAHNSQRIDDEALVP